MTGPPGPGHRRRRIDYLAAIDASDTSASRADRRVLDALATVRAELAGLNPARPPGHVADRWAAAIAAEGSAPPRAPRRIRRDPGRPAGAESVTTGRRRTGFGVAVGTALTGLAAATAAIMIAPGTAVDTGTAATRGSDGPAVSVTGDELAGVAVSTIGVGLDEQATAHRLSGCVAAAGAEPVLARDVLGVRTVVLDGVPGTLLVTATGERGRLRIVSVDVGCTRTLADRTTR